MTLTHAPRVEHGLSRNNLHALSWALSAQVALVDYLDRNDLDALSDALSGRTCPAWVQSES